MEIGFAVCVGIAFSSLIVVIFAFIKGASSIEPLFNYLAPLSVGVFVLAFVASICFGTQLPREMGEVIGEYELLSLDREGGSRSIGMVVDYDFRVTDLFAAEELGIVLVKYKQLSTGGLAYMQMPYFSRTTLELISGGGGLVIEKECKTTLFNIHLWGCPSYVHLLIPENWW